VWDIILFQDLSQNYSHRLIKDKRHAAFITIKVRKINKIIDQIEEVHLK
jgi:hypothetical protein